MVERVADNGAAEGVFHDGAVLRVAGNETGGDGDEARLALADGILQRLGPDGGEGQEGRAAAVAALEHLDGGFAVFLGGDDDILHGRAERGLDGGGIAVFDADELGDRAVDAAQASGACVLHDEADGLGKALIVALKLLQHADLGIEGIELDAGGARLLLQGVALVLPGPEPELVAGDGVFRALRVLLRLGKALFAGGLLVGDLGFAGTGGGQVLFEDGFAGLHLFHGSLHGGDLRLGGCALRLQKRLLGVQGGQLLACRGSFAGEGVRLRLRLRESLFGLGKLLIICRDLLLLGRDLPGDAAAAGLLVLQLLLHASDVGAVVLDLGLQEGDVVLGLLAGGLELADGLALVVELEGLLVILQAQLLGAAVESGQLVVRLLEDEGGGGVVGLGLAGGLGDLFEVFEPDGDLEPTELAAERQILLRLFRLLFQGADLQLQLGDLVADAQKIVLGVGQTALGILLAVAEFGDAGGFLENFAAVGRFEGKDLVDAALADVGIALAAKTGVHEQLVDVLEAGKLLVDIVFALAGAEIAAGDHDLGGLDAKAGVGVVEDEGGLGVADGGALGGAAEDDVFHLRAAQGAGALLA